jgi:hypothetical protein
MTGPIDRLGQWLRNEQIPAVNSHMELHCLLGDAWFASYYEAGIGSSGTVDILAIPGPATGTPSEAHLFRRIAVQADSLLYAGETFNVTSSGTLMAAANFRRSLQGVVTPSLLLYSQPTLTGVTGLQGPQYLPGGNTANAQGITYEDPYPITMGPGIPAIFRVQNNSGRATDMGIEFKWYEDIIRDPGEAGYVGP